MRGVRTREPEWMDHPSADPEELERSLADLRAVNRWLGASRLMLRLVKPLLFGIRERPIRLLDVATGSGDLPLLLVRRARASGLQVRAVAGDLHPVTLRAARAHAAGEPDVQVVGADARALPFGDGAFHLVTCATALHHFDDSEAVEVLREMNRVARAGVVVTDLPRSRTALWGVRALGATVWRNHPITRHDSVTSVRAAFTAGELRRLGGRAGLRGARVRSHPLACRISLVVDRTAGGER